MESQKAKMPILPNGIELKGTQTEQFFRHMEKNDVEDQCKTLAKTIKDNTKLRVRYEKYRDGRVINRIVVFE